MKNIVKVENINNKIIIIKINFKIKNEMKINMKNVKKIAKNRI